MPATDAFSRQRALTNDPYTNAVAVTPHDTNDLTVAFMLVVQEL